jgi:hypothetical protein
MLLVAHEHAPKAVPPELQTWKPAHPEGPAQATDAPGTHGRDATGDDNEPPQVTVSATTATSPPPNDVWWPRPTAEDYSYDG